MAFVDTALDFQLSLARLAPNTHVATILGEADLHNEETLREALWPLAEPEGATVIVDLCCSSFVDSTVLGVLVGLAKQLRSQHGQLVVVSDDPRFRKLLEITGLLHVLQLERSLAKAVESSVGGTAV
jgi:anti-sigma B factor antagonist